MKITEALVTSAATYRVTKLVIDDEITRELREAAFAEIDKIKNTQIREKLNYFLTCPWCVSIWAAGGLLAIKLVAPNAYKYLTLLLAASAATGVAYEKL